jgi:hypothetical protein
MSRAGDAARDDDADEEEEEDVARVAVTRGLSWGCPPRGAWGATRGGFACARSKPSACDAAMARSAATSALTEEDPTPVAPCSPPGPRVSEKLSCWVTLAEADDDDEEPTGEEGDTAPCSADPA